jgi:hypothetical protein
MLFGLGEGESSSPKHFFRKRRNLINVFGLTAILLMLRIVFIFIKFTKLTKDEFKDKVIIRYLKGT